jgi:hypothetical protein
MKSTYNIIYPEQTTYFIAYTNSEIFAYGIVSIKQEMTTGQPILWTTLIEEEWKLKLEIEFNTNPYKFDEKP